MEEFLEGLRGDVRWLGLMVDFLKGEGLMGVWLNLEDCFMINLL